MGPEPQRTNRDDAVRAMLVDRVVPPATSPMSGGVRTRGGLVTAVVLVVVVALSVIAIRVSDGHNRPAFGGLSSTTPAGPPTPSIPAGKLLGTFTSNDGPNQKHTIHPNGLAIASVFACTGKGSYTVSIAHDGSTGGDGGCGAGESSGSKGVAGSTTVTIKTDADMHWSLTVVGIPERYVTPQPIATPTDGAGTAVPFCAATDLAARFEPTKEPKGVTEVSGGQVAVTNTTGATCVLVGYPMVRFLDGGTVLGHHTMNATDKRMSTEKGLREVILKPGGLAYTQVGWYLPNYYPENGSGACVARPVSALRIDLENRLAGPGQRGSLPVPIGSTVVACLNGPWGVNGKYGQISSTVFVNYSLGRK